MLQTVDAAVHLCAPQEELEPQSHGLGMDAMSPANAGSMLEFYGAAAHHLAEFLQIFQDDICSVLQLQAGSGIFHIRGRKSHMDVLGILAHILGHGGQEGDEVVVGNRLDLKDALHGEDRAGSHLLTDALHSIFGDVSQLCSRIASGQLYLQHPLPLGGIRPNSAHLRIRVTCDHQFSSLKSLRRHCTAEVKTTQRKNSN